MIHSNSCEVTIQGIEPGVLLNNPAGLAKKPGGKKVEPTPEEDAVGRLYWTDDKESIAFPGHNLHRGLIRAASGWKLPTNRKVALTPFIAGDVSVTPEMIPFKTITYGIFTTRCVIRGQSILRSRPNLKVWSLEFIVKWESQHLGKDFHETLLPELLARLGSSIGIGDFRPEKSGRFGRFVIERIRLK